MISSQLFFLDFPKTWSLSVFVKKTFLCGLWLMKESCFEAPHIIEYYKTKFFCGSFNSFHHHQFLSNPLSIDSLSGCVIQAPLFGRVPVMGLFLSNHWADYKARISPSIDLHRFHFSTFTGQSIEGLCDGEFYVSSQLEHEILSCLVSHYSGCFWEGVFGLG